MSAPIPDPIQQQPQNPDPVPAWARQQITEANSEAASNRIAARDAKAEAADYKGQLDTANNDKASAVTRAETAEAKLMRIEVALAAGVPGDRLASIVERLKGTTEAELKADAEQLVKDFGIAAPGNDRPTDHSQGRGSETPAVPNTPEAAFAQMWSDHFKN